MTACRWCGKMTSMAHHLLRQGSNNEAIILLVLFSLHFSINCIKSKWLNQTIEDVTIQGIFETHSDKLQFSINVIIVILTVATLALTWFYSNRNLTLSTKQYQASVMQFNYQRGLDSLKRISDSIKDRVVTQRLMRDSIVQLKKDSIQSIRNAMQDSLNSRQLKINAQQLLVAKGQTQTLKNQLAEQTRQYNEQFSERRPYFGIDNVNVDSVLDYKPKVSFVFSNKGIRTAHIDSTILAFSNPLLGCFSITPNTANLDNQSSQGALTTSSINIFKNCLESSSTIFLLVVYYSDFAKAEEKKEFIFFQYSFNKQKQFTYRRLLPSQVPNEFKSFLKKKKIVVQ